MLCITIEVKPRILKQCKCHDCYVCKNYRGMVMEDGGKSVFTFFLADQKTVSVCIFWPPTTQAARYTLTVGL